MIALLLAAFAAGLSNLAAAIGMGTAGVDASTRLRVGVVFGAFEAGMPVVGMLIGQRLATEVGRAVRWPGAMVLVAMGVYTVLRSVREQRRSPAPGHVPGLAALRRPGIARLLAAGLVLSMDNLVIGVALGSYGIGILGGAIVIGAVSVGMSLAGLELGAVAGRWADRRSQQLGGFALIMLGLTIAGRVLD